MAKMLYHTLHEKIMTLPDETEIYPAHGAGSSCGKNISSDRFSTLGNQKKTNYALKTKNVDEFVHQVADDLSPPPPYFPLDTELNRKGPRPLQDLPKLPPYSPKEFTLQKNKGALIVDVRSSEDFCKTHIPDSIHISLNGSFGPWAGTVIPAETPLLLVADESKIDESRMRLARVGLEKVVGYLKGGMEAWKKSGNETSQIAMTEVAGLKKELEGSSQIQVIDVRRSSEFEKGHVPKAVNLPLAELTEEKLSFLNRNLPTHVICQSGYRSAIAVSLLERFKFHRLINVTGGTTAWKNASYPLSH
jgi:rhodanese-related sulfurtransferase